MADLSVKDLMVGDWVKSQYGNQYCKIKRNWNDMVDTTYISSVHLDDIEPIPLTPEILLKIGLEFDGRSFTFSSEYIDENDSSYILNFELTPKGDGYEWTINGDKYSICFIKYLHQLQHIFKLIGCDKEIIL